MAVPWALALALLLVLPQIFAANSTVTILNQMGITIVFALSYDMLLGQAGMLSFGHAIYMGMGGFACIHAMNHVQAAGLAVPLPVLPLFGGLFSLGVATVIGAFSTRRTGTIFAMISLGIVELIAALSIVITAFFRQGGVGADRTLGPTVFGNAFLRQVDVYYVIAAWLLACAALMYLFSRTPVGRMANAVRDNPERAEYLGYSAHWVRFLSFCAAGFFAGIAGGLFAICYEISTAENLGLQASGTILMITFLGGVGHFLGPALGAVVFTLLQTVLSFETDLWQFYVGLLFLAAVMYFPTGLSGLIAMHGPVIRQGRVAKVAPAYCAVVLPAALGGAGLVTLTEMVFHGRHAITGDSTLRVFWISLDTQSPLPWMIALGLAGVGIGVARNRAPYLRSVWQGSAP